MASDRTFDPSRCRLAAFDLDGTVLCRGDMSSAVGRAIRGLHDRGVEVVVATGRHAAAIPPEIRRLPFLRYAITSSGAHVLDLHRRETIQYTPIDAALSTRLAERLEPRATVTEIYVQDRILESPRTMFLPRQALPTVKVKNSPLGFFRMYRLVANPYRWVVKRHAEVEKFDASFRTMEECAAMMAELKAEREVEVLTTTDFEVEILARGVDKGMGLAALCRHLGIEREDVVAFGDSANDLGMLRYAGYSVAMGNARDDVRAAADFVADDVRSDGVARAVERLFTPAAGS